MDPGVLAMLIPIAAIVCGTYIAVERIKSRRMPGTDVLQRVQDLEAEMDRVHEELASTQERLDFAERMLAKQKDVKAVGGGA